MAGRNICYTGSDVISELDLFAIGSARTHSGGIAAQRGQCEGREAVLGEHIDLGYDDNLVYVWVIRRKVFMRRELPYMSSGRTRPLLLDAVVATSPVSSLYC